MHDFAEVMIVFAYITWSVVINKEFFFFIVLWFNIVDVLDMLSA